jgi:hypothetical protein
MVRDGLWPPHHEVTPEERRRLEGCGSVKTRQTLETKVTAAYSPYMAAALFLSFMAGAATTKFQALLGVVSRPGPGNEQDIERLQGAARSQMCMAGIPRINGRTV